MEARMEGEMGWLVLARKLLRNEPPGSWGAAASSRSLIVLGLPSFLHRHNCMNVIHVWACVCMPACAPVVCGCVCAYARACVRVYACACE